MKNTKNLVPVEDFNIDILREAYLQGRLYIQIEETSRADLLNATKEKSIRSILQYVSRIGQCASPPYATTIHRLWEDILHSPQLGPLFFLNRYSTNRGQPNWYRVNAVVMVLLENNIYRRDTYTSVQLHLQMEQATKRNSHYTSMNRYLLDRQQIKLLLQYTERLRIPDQNPIPLQQNQRNKKE